MRPPWRWTRWRAIMLRQRWPSSPWDLESMESGPISHTPIHGRFHRPRCSLRCLRRSYSSPPSPCPCNRRSLIGVDRLYPPMAQAIASRVENPFNGFGGQHRRTGHCPQHGLVNLSRRIRGFHGRATMRFGSRWNPLFYLSTLQGCAGWIGKCSHSAPRKGCWSFHRSLIFRASLRATEGNGGQLTPDLNQHENHSLRIPIR